MLVTQQNQVLDILTWEQQQVLEQQITWIVAEYGRRSGFWRLPHWISTKIRRLFGAAPSPAALPAPSADALALPGATELQVDAPIWQSLATVQHILEATESRGQATQLAIATALTPASNIFIRGIASLIEERSLVLVTNQNQLLNVLTCEQQEVIHQRIIWEVANYYRYLQLRQRAQGLTPLQPPSRNSQAWLPVRVFQGVMAWMQSGPIAIATNLFQEASFPPASWSDPNSLPALPDRNSPALPGLFQKLQDRLSTVLTPSPQLLDKEKPSPPEASSLTSATRSTPAVAGQAPLGPRNGSNPLAGGEERSPEFIETDVTLIGYEFSWLERVIRWLDRCFLWVESVWNRLLNGSPDRSSPTQDD